MSHRRLIATAAVLAAGVAFIPGPALAADPPHATDGNPVRATAPTAAIPELRIFSSPASHAIRLPNPAGGVASSRATGSGRTIYAESQSTLLCSTDHGTGTQASPYCDLQNAVNAASPGDTVTFGGFFAESVTVKTSGISIVGDSVHGTRSRIDGLRDKPALLLDGVTGVTVSNLMATGYTTPAVQITQSSGITLDADNMHLFAGIGTGGSALAIDGTSSSITVSRSYADTGSWSLDTRGISIAPGASHITLASNVLADTGITATGVNGLDVAGNTIQRGCTSAIDIEGASSGVHLENNLLEDANTGTPFAMGYQSQCSAGGPGTAPWAPDIVVAAGSGTATTADYNDFAVYGSDATAPYSWAGTSYPTLTAFQTGTAQGAHDTLDSKEAAPVLLAPQGGLEVDVALQTGSAAINSANPDAPGEAASDFYGSSPYTSRGATQYLSTDAGLAVALSAQDTSAFGIELAVQQTTTYQGAVCSFDWGDGTTTSTALSGGANPPFPHRYAKAGTYTVTATVSDNAGNRMSNNVSVTTAGSEYTPYGPTRLLDTRYGIGAPAGQVGSDKMARVQIAGNGSIPSRVSAVVVNLTVTNPTDSGFITAYADGGVRPSTSNVNFTAGQTVPNMAIVPVGADGYIDLFNSGLASVDLIADVTGYFTQDAASGYTSLPPNRIVDTRNDSQVPGLGSIAAQVAGNGSVPPSGVTAVALNVTVTNPRSDGFLTVYPDGQDTPNASNVNYLSGQTIANSVVVPVGADGKIRIHNGGGLGADVVVDVVGYYSPDSKSAYLPIKPTRLLDTRDPKWTPGPLDPGNYIYMPFNDDQSSSTAVVLNTTVTDTKGGGFLTVSPDPNTLTQYDGTPAARPTRPNTSVLNWLPGQTVPNLVQASTGPTADGIIDFWNTGSGTINLVVDAFGFYQNY
ncbi:hypothetical protein P3T37_005759 [Kitasatospora sp. MAA4]|uniref:PKD domain-containing protein n=1 Tax=Kitasatospora sp. MAA4 TaxID=3035093 RepID=UPI002476E1F7|nr:PKD domain-containing protein [Kitasatospora sp. MAA4]MDH6136334.1 hypothetical protein [Kitasatospora sp. MAA4]